MTELTAALSDLDDVNAVLAGDANAGQAGSGQEGRALLGQVCLVLAFARAACWPDTGNACLLGCAGAVGCGQQGEERADPEPLLCPVPEQAV
jgi:hypothetical protein